MGGAVMVKNVFRLGQEVWSKENTFGWIVSCGKPASMAAAVADIVADDGRLLLANQ
jgi:hypothetical protein